MKKIFFLIIVLLCYCPCIVQAKKCTDSQINRYEKLVSNIQTTYNYTETENGLTFDISFHNVYTDFEIADYNTNNHLSIYKENKDGIIVVPSYLPGQTYKFSILNNGKTCDMMIIKEIKVTLPNYNQYYKDPVCEGVSEFELCQKWSNIGNLTYKQLQKSVEDYKKQHLELKPDDLVLPEQTTLDQIRNFMAKYYIYIVAVGLLIASVVVYFIHKVQKNKW